ncbi:septum formation family protein [Streptomyces sp. KLOTTS4A1]|uniref:DUF4190 domain-containing protein n=1 Tax=Streptomyces sp. KLOTTS4A1 TaxID=3390996 RepID=UPI0039F6442C
MAIPPPPQDNPYGPPPQNPQTPPGGAQPSYGSQGQGGQQLPGGQQPPYGQPHYGQPHYGQQPYVPGQPPYGQYPGHGGYGGYGNGWQPHPSAPGTSGLAVAALVTCVLCFLPLGLIFGILALRQIKRGGQSGKGLAVSGIVVNAVTLLLTAVFFVSGGASEFWDGFREGMREAQQTATPEKGECFNAPGGELEGLTYSLDIVPCTRPHDGEAFGSFELVMSEYPGQGRIDDLADARCGAMVEDYVGDIEAVPADIAIYFYGPTRQSWDLGDREVSCILGKESGGKSTGSLRDAGRDGAGGSGGGADAGDGDQGDSGDEGETAEPDADPAPGQGTEV